MAGAGCALRRRHTPRRRPHGSMDFRSFAAVNGLRPPEAARVTRAIDSRKTSEKGGFHEVDGALCRGRAALAAARIGGRAPSPLAGEGGVAQQRRMRGRAETRASRGASRMAAIQTEEASNPPLSRKQRALRRDPSSIGLRPTPSPARGEGERILRTPAPPLPAARRAELRPAAPTLNRAKRCHSIRLSRRKGAVRYPIPRSPAPHDPAS
jgi:hypothetical protein